MRGLLGVSALLVLALAPCLTGVDAVRADVGVGVDLGRVTLEARLTPGGRYRLPTLTVSNPGDVAGAFRVRVTDPEEPGRTAPPEEWFRLEPQRFQLAPGASQPVQVALELPAGAQPGRYAAYLEASPVGGDGGVQVGAAAATLVVFDVKPASRWEAWRLQALQYLDDHSPWPQITAGMVLLAGGAALARRHLRIGVTIQRRR